MENEELLQKLIAVFLEINPDPPDEQFHMLARSIGMDPPELEAVAYKMLAVEDQETETLSATDEESVLDGDYDPDTTTPDNLLLNDGEPGGSGQNTDTQVQDDLYDDGVGVEDFGVDVQGDQTLLYDDGKPAMQLRASTRLGLKGKK